ncbi:MAG: T9SS type A sorting domain-containing protein, partial [Hymenobacter sp.]
GTAFTPGNVVVVRVGTGAAPLTTAAAPVFLAEYTPTGTLVQTRPLPTADAGTDLAFTDSGTAYSDNNLTRSADGRYLVLTGYHAVPGTAGLVSTSAATTNRLIGRVAADGTINTSTRISDAFNPTNIRAAASLDGTAFYAVGGSSTVRYVPLGNAGPTTAISTGSQVNFRSVGIADGNFYVTSAASPNFGISQVGMGLPTAPGAAVRLLPGFSTVSGSPYALYFADLSAAVAGPDVVYVVDDSPTSGIQKWSLVGSTWKLNGTIGGSTTALLRGLAGTASGTSVSLLASSSNGLYSVADNAGYNAAPSVATLPQPFVKPPTNTVFRGVAFAPQAASLAKTRAVARAATPIDLTVFPVPATRQLVVQLGAGPEDSPAQVALFDKMGQQVLSQHAPVAANATLTLATENLPSGLYTLRVLVAGRAVSKQVIITH